MIVWLWDADRAHGVSDDDTGPATLAAMRDAADAFREKFVLYAGDPEAVT
jgi:hypothetical protein